MYRNLPASTKKYSLLSSFLFCSLSDLGVRGIKNMNQLPDYVPFDPIPSQPLNQLFTAASSSALSLLENLLKFNPLHRLSALPCLKHTYFVEAPAPTPHKLLPKQKKKKNTLSQGGKVAGRPEMMGGKEKSGIAKETGMPITERLKKEVKAINMVQNDNEEEVIRMPSKGKRKFVIEDDD